MKHRTAVCSLALGWLLAGCGGGSPREGAIAADQGPLPPSTRGIILISFDTLRADHLGAYGYERDTSPFFDSLAERGTRFTQAFVQYPSTLTSHMSMLTGLYPAEHGVYPPNAVLAPEVETVAEVFQRHGFATAGHTEGGYVRGRFGFRRGFDEFRARDRQGPREIEHTFRRGVEFLERLGPEDRFFLFLHTYAVHAPYRPPEGYEDRFWQSDPPPIFRPTGPRLARHNAEGGRLPPEVLAYFEALYDATIRYADDVLRGFFGELERLGLSDQVTVVLTSDHGEEFQEHGRMNHEQLYREVLRVPLVILHPDLPAGRHDPLVESVDLAPTLYELARIAPLQHPSGRSLARRLGRTTTAAEDAGRQAYAEVSSGVKALWSYGPGPRAQTARRLFHLLLFDTPEDSWESRRLLLDTAGTTLTFEARSYGEPRPLSLHRRGPDGAFDDLLGTAELGLSWSPVTLTLGPAPIKHTLQLSVPACTAPEDVAGPRQWRCYGFQVRGVPRVRLELYDALADPEEARDLSTTLDEPTRRLLRALRELRFEPRAAAAVEALDAETEEQLRALGYLQ